ncbi:MAG TPA: hypothetical protein VMZ92_18090, partial [Planctomycetota bacterium]|nr:hypothetical protein [Planctomycetota bacterium]
SEGRSNAYLRLIRFPLIFATWSDVLTGHVIAAAQTPEVLHPGRVAMMLAVTTFLGTGGMTLCDCFEYESDKEHGRPGSLPLGVISLHAAFAAAFILILLAVAGATWVSASAGLLTVVVALLFLVFASVTREMPFAGAANLSVIRGLSIILGMAFAHQGGPLVPKVECWGPVAALVGFVFIVTRIVSEEKHPRRERLLRLTATLILLLVIFNVLLYVLPLSKASVTLCVIVSVFVAGVVMRFLQLVRRSVHELSTASVQKLVVAGLVGTIVVNANFVAFTGEADQTLGVLFLLLPAFIMFRFLHVLYPGTQTAID